MKGAIAYALNFPRRLAGATSAIDWKVPHNWSFEPIATERFPAVGLARHCGEIGGSMPAVFNAANEVAVAAFISEKIAFTKILPLVEAVVGTVDGASSMRDLVDVSLVEDNARALAHEHLLRLAP
jgi:1-deoxy-D-xylulose-5-phosphate reductoisomerase